jgi:hypothetical protein
MMRTHAQVGISARLSFVGTQGSYPSRPAAKRRGNGCFNTQSPSAMKPSTSDRGRSVPSVRAARARLEGSPRHPSWFPYRSPPRRRVPPACPPKTRLPRPYFSFGYGSLTLSPPESAPSVRTLTVRARRQMCDRARVELVAAVGAAVRTRGHVAADWCWDSHGRPYVQRCARANRAPIAVPPMT